MSPQPEQKTNGRHADLEKLFLRGTILREAARRARATSREIREASPWFAKKESGPTRQD